LAPALIVIHDALLDAVHAQVLPAVMLTVPLPPEATAVALVGESV
jgi:hypothetical protein